MKLATLRTYIILYNDDARNQGRASDITHVADYPRPKSRLPTSAPSTVSNSLTVDTVARHHKVFQNYTDFQVLFHNIFYNAWIATGVCNAANPRKKPVTSKVIYDILKTNVPRSSAQNWNNNSDLKLWIKLHVSTRTYTWVRMCVFVCVSVHVCVCVRVCLI